MRFFKLFLALLCVAAAASWGLLLAASRRPAAVLVESAPRQAAVYLNGRFLGHAPLRIPHVPPGPHVLRVVHPERQPHQAVIDADELYGRGAERLRRKLRREEPVVRVELRRPDSSWLIVESTPSGAEVIVNGEMRGLTPLRLEGLEPGAYDIHIARTGYAAHRETVELAPDEGAAVRTRLHARIIDVLAARLEEDPYNMQDLVDLSHQYLILGLHQESADTLRRAFEVMAEGKATVRPGQDERPETRFIHQCYRTFIRFHTYPEEGSHVVREACMELMRKAAERNLGGRNVRNLLQRMERYEAQNR